MSAKGVAVPPTAGYFVDQRKGEVNELKALLKNMSVERDPKRKRDIIKKVIAYMTLGIDVSRLFTDMIMAIETRDIVVKKMVYLYLCNYAHKQPEMAIMCINTLTRDCDNEDPMIRGLALRSLCSLKLPSMVEYISRPLQKSLTDLSAYVRKTGVMGVCKLFYLSPDLVKFHSDYVSTLYYMMQDVDAAVVANCIMALNEILGDDGGLSITQSTVLSLLNRIAEFSEWGLCLVLDLVAKYTPVDDNERFSIMNLLDPVLRTSNAGAVLGTIRCFLHIVSDLPLLQPQVYERCKAPLLTLMTGGTNEIVYALLKHLEVIIPRCPGLYDDDYRQFYVRYNEPSYVKHLKADILPMLANGGNANDIANELGEYVVDVDAELSRRGIRALSKIGMKVPVTAVNMILRLIELMDLDMPYVRAEAVSVCVTLIRLYPDVRGHFLPYIPRALKNIEEEDARVCLLYLLGEFCDEITEAPYLLESLIDNLSVHSPTIKLTLLSSTMKVFFKRAPETQAMLGRLLTGLVNDTSNQDVHDRALLYYRLLCTHPQVCECVFKDVGGRVPVTSFAEERDEELKALVFQEFGTLSIIYGKPSNTFLSERFMIYSKGFKEFEPTVPQHDEYDEEVETNGESASVSVDLLGGEETSSTNPNTSAGLLDLDLVAPTSVPPAIPSAPVLRDDIMLDAAGFQAKWVAFQESANEMLCVLRRPPTSSAEVEGLMRSNRVKTIASGELPDAFKFFFYAGDSTGILFLAQMMVNKASGQVTVTVKSTDTVSHTQSMRRMCDAMRASLTTFQ